MRLKRENASNSTQGTRNETLVSMRKAAMNLHWWGCRAWGRSRGCRTRSWRWRDRRRGGGGWGSTGRRGRTGARPSRCRGVPKKMEMTYSPPMPPLSATGVEKSDNCRPLNLIRCRSCERFAAASRRSLNVVPSARASGDRGWSRCSRSIRVICMHGTQIKNPDQAVNSFSRIAKPGAGHVPITSSCMLPGMQSGRH
jgi:hypothetical protein